MTAERDALRQQQILEGETHAKELACAAIAGKLFSDYHAASYGQVVAEMVTLEDMGIKAEEYPPAQTYEAFVAIAHAKDPSVSQLTDQV